MTEDGHLTDGPAGADPFLWTTLVALVPGAAGAALAPGHAPAYALHSTGVYKLEIGLVFFIAAYGLGLIVHLAYQGRSLGQLNLGVVQANLPDPDAGLSEARSGFSEFEASTKGRLTAHDENFAELEARLQALEARPGDREQCPKPSSHDASEGYD